MLNIDVLNFISTSNVLLEAPITDFSLLPSLISVTPNKITRCFNEDHTIFMIGQSDTAPDMIVYERTLLVGVTSKKMAKIKREAPKTVTTQAALAEYVARRLIEPYFHDIWSTDAFVLAYCEDRRVS